MYVWMLDMLTAKNTVNRISICEWLLCSWWDWQRIIHYELRPYNQTLNLEFDCYQLDHVKKAIAQLSPKGGELRFTHIYSDSPVALIAWLGDSYAITL